jgi:hypothetical protein
MLKVEPAPGTVLEQLAPTIGLQTAPHVLTTRRQPSDVSIYRRACIQLDAICTTELDCMLDRESFNKNNAVQINKSDDS